jgi:putative endonuclease
MEVLSTESTFKKKAPVLSTERVSLGRLCEKLAEAYLRKKGWFVCQRNVRFRTGEIDLIALDESSGQNWIVEVRGRRESPRKAAHWLSPSKVFRLRKLAEIMSQKTGRLHRVLFIQVELKKGREEVPQFKEFEIRADE